MYVSSLCGCLWYSTTSVVISGESFVKTCNLVQRVWSNSLGLEITGVGFTHNSFAVSHRNVVTPPPPFPHGGLMFTLFWDRLHRHHQWFGFCWRIDEFAVVYCTIEFKGYNPDFYHPPLHSEWKNNGWGTMIQKWQLIINLWVFNMKHA